MSSNNKKLGLGQSQSLTGLAAFQKVLQLTQPQGNSRELWLKLGHNLFLVGDYHPSGHFPVWETIGKGTKRIRTRYHSDCWEFVTNWCKDNNGGVFFIPTQPQGYPLKDYIKLSDDIAAELDNGTATEQWDKIEQFSEISRLKPAYIIHSGSKSYHPHWKITEHLPIEQTVYLRRLLCIALDSDPAVTNPHQPMRIAGFYRREKKREQTLCYWHESRYSYADLIAGFKDYFAAKGLDFPATISDERWRMWKRWGNKVLAIPEAELLPQFQPINLPSISSTYTGDIPLHECLSQANQSALSGVSSNRNLTGYALACDLIGCADWLTSNGYHYHSDSYSLFISYCHSCTSGGGWNQHEWEAIWRSANSSHPTPARGDDGLNKFIHWYRWSTERSSGVRLWGLGVRDTALKERDLRPSFKLKPLLHQLGQKLKQNQHRTNRKLAAWGFSSEQIKGYEQAKLLPIYYQPSHRLDTWQNTGKWIFDASGTGTGKSFDTGRLNLAQLDVSRAFYITSDPRNPSTTTLADWDYLNGRHGGLTRDIRGKLRVAKAKDTITIGANCGRTQTIAALKNASVDSADSAELICRGCNWYEACNGGHVFGYLGSRREALTQTKLRTHPLSLPHPEEFDEYEDSLLIWDEWSSILTNTKQIQVGQSDLVQLTTNLLTESPLVLTQLQPILTTLGKLFKAKPPTRYGWNHQALISEFPSLSHNIDKKAILSATQPDLNILNPTAEYGEDIDNLPPSVRKKFNDSDSQTAKEIANNVLKQWLIPFLDVLQGEVGYLSLSQGILTITVPHPHLVNIAHAAKKNIFLDATGSVAELALLLGLKIADIDHIAVKPRTGAEIKYIQVAGMGRLGQQRGNYQQQQVEAVINQIVQDNPDAGTIRFKKLARGKDLRWFIESRGVNDGENLNTLILDGIPCPNLASLAAAFTCLYGRQPQAGTEKIKYPLKLTNSLPEGIQPYLEIEVSSDPEFNQFVRQRILANLHQGWGRTRANRRSGEQLTVYILGDYPLDVPVEIVKAVDITPEAASKIEKFEMALKNAVAQLQAQGHKITQQALAQITGYSQGYISRFRKLLQTLIESFYSKSNNSPSSSDDVIWMAQEYLPLATSEQLASEIFNLSEVFNLWDWVQLWQSAPASTQINLLSSLILALPASDLEKLRAIHLQ